MEAYFDNAATTKPCRACIEAVTAMLENDYGNPSSLHGMGTKAALKIKAVRETVARSLHTEQDEIYFTSGGTEANNLALFGAAYAGRRRGKRIVTTAIEHESVLEAAAQLEKEGFEVIRLLPDRFGRITEAQLFDAITPDTILVSVMLVNNEVGAVLPVEAVRRAVKRAGAPTLVHTDCVQAYGKMPLRPDKLGVDLMTVTAHKIHGPKGVGALYIKKGARILPRTFGGEQEKKLRPGTECSPLIAGFGAAIDALPPVEAAMEQIKALRDFTAAGLQTIDGLLLNSAEDAFPYVLSVYVPTFMQSQPIIQALGADYGIFISSGSACAKGRRSHVLTAMHLGNERINSSVRISFSRYNTVEEAKYLIGALQTLVQKAPKSVSGSSK